MRALRRCAVEYNHDFGAGVYAHGDVTFRNYRAAWNIKGLYWKTYRRGAGSGPLCESCAFYESTPELPGGDGLVEFGGPMLHQCLTAPGGRPVA